MTVAWDVNYTVSRRKSFPRERPLTETLPQDQTAAVERAHTCWWRKRAGGASSSMAWPRGGAKGHPKSSRGCLVKAAAELLGYHPRGSRGRDDA